MGRIDCRGLCLRGAVQGAHFEEEEEGGGKGASLEGVEGRHTYLQKKTKKSYGLAGVMTSL